jgi:type IV pilus assembly protein PilY1
MNIGKFFLTFCLLGLLLVSPAIAEVPTITSTTPANNNTNVGINDSITITFSGAVTLSSVQSAVSIYNTSTSTAFTAFTVSTDDNTTYTLTLGSSLNNSTTYKVTVNTDVTSTSGDKLAAAYTFYFTTESNTDTVPPTVTSVYPTAGAAGIPLDTTVSAKFSESMSTYGITLLNTSTSAYVSGTVAYDSSSYTATFTPTSSLANSTTYTVTITGKDLVGLDLDSSTTTSWSFTTVTTDSTPPTIKSTYPVSGATSVPVSAAVVAKFSEAMLSSSITTSTFYISGVSGTVTYDSSTNTATFTPAASLGYATDYKVYVTTGVKDLSGNSLQTTNTWTFTTTQSTTTASMTDYAQVPSCAATTSVKPNVMMIVDNSGSMYDFAYKTSGAGASSNNYDTSYSSSTSYYGYFDNTAMYSYSSNVFTVNSSATLDKTNPLSGNFLNWLTMRRVDVIRKVLIGGKMTPRTAGSANYLVPTESPDRDYYKKYGSYYYYVGPGPSIYKCTSSNCSSNTSSKYIAATYKNFKIYYGTTVPDDGIVQNYATKVQMGMMKFNTTGALYEQGNSGGADGGSVVATVGSTQATLISAIEAADPSANTPLAETFYEAIRYFQATSSAYNSSTSYSSSDPIQYACQKNFVLIVTDGASTQDMNIPGSNWSGYTTKVTDSYGFDIKTWMSKIATNEGTTTLYATSPSLSGTYYLAGLAYYAHNTDLRSSSVGKSAVSGTQNITTYTVFAFDDDAFGSKLLKLTSKYGGYVDNDSSGTPYTDSTCGTTSAKSGCAEWDADGDGVPDTYFEASEGSALVTQLTTAFNNILSRVTSGTAASILSNSAGSGATLLQALFYPSKTFDSNTATTWLGEVHGLWYYLDPYLKYSTIRVDTTSDFKLNTLNDYIAQFYFNDSDSKTEVALIQDTTGTGTTLSTIGTSYTPDDTTNVKSLWRAGRSLWGRDLSNDSRTIYTQTGISSLDTVQDLNNNSLGLALFNASTLAANTSVQTWLQAANTTEASKIINYVRGTDQSGYRSRTVTIGTTSGTWRLGDIVTSTPKVEANTALNSYDKAASVGYGDASYSKFIASHDYATRGMAYVGANDGMLHAFKLGILNEMTDPCRLSGADASTCKYDKARILNADGTIATSSSNLGHEEWAFVPRQMLPYLKYLGDTSYPHLFYVDGTPKIVDMPIHTPSSYTASDYPNCSSNYWECPKQTVYKTVNNVTTYLDPDNTSWRTIMIVGTGLGGASRNRGDGCYTSGSGNCVYTPVAGTGYSSYFALDITTPSTPKFLWEFHGDPSTSGNLGFTTGGPAIVRVGNRAQNGRWFAIFASGPTGPIDTTNYQFLGRSDQPLNIFIVDIATGTLVRTITTTITNAFAGSLANATLDTDRSSVNTSGNYQDDAVYIGYVQQTGTTTNWNSGGVLRLLTHQSTDPSNWTLSPVITGIGPVTTSVTKLQDRTNKNLWLYFGTGRYFYKNSTEIDDQTAIRYLYGIKDPCYTSSNTLNTSCTATALTTSSLTDETSITSFSSSSSGWYIGLAPYTSSYGSERVITDPVASTSGLVYFTTFMPSSDVCGYGGNSYVWAVKYNTGGLPASLTLAGKLMLQVSTGAFAEISASSFASSRKSSAITGMPPLSSGLSVTTNPKPVKRFLHIQER